MLRELHSLGEPTSLVLVANGRRVAGWEMPEQFEVILPDAVTKEGEGHGGCAAGPAGAYLVCDEPEMGGWFVVPPKGAVPAAKVDAMKAGG